MHIVGVTIAALGGHADQIGRALNGFSTTTAIVVEVGVTGATAIVVGKASADAGAVHLIPRAALIIGVQHGVAKTIALAIKLIGETASTTGIGGEPTIGVAAVSRLVERILLAAATMVIGLDKVTAAWTGLNLGAVIGALIANVAVEDPIAIGILSRTAADAGVIWSGSVGHASRQSYPSSPKMALSPSVSTSATLQPQMPGANLFGSPDSCR